jgi:hypothetical protein
VLIYTSRKSNLLALLCANRGDQGDLGQISLDGHNTTTGRGGSNVNHENFTLGQLGNLALLVTLSLNSEKTAQQEKVDFEVSENLRQMSDGTKNLTDQTTEQTIQVLAR